MAANTTPIFPVSPKAGWLSAAITAANTNMDGTGTVGTVFTAGANGSYLYKLRIKALGSNVATVMRVFLNNGSTNATPANNALIGEISLPIMTANAAGALPDFEYQLNVFVPNGYVVNVTLGTAVAAGYMVTCFAGDY